MIVVSKSKQRLIIQFLTSENIKVKKLSQGSEKFSRDGGGRNKLFG